MINHTLELPDINYTSEMSDKHQIVIGHSYSKDMDYINRWTNRLNGKYKYTVPFSIDKDGTIYQHYDTNFTSRMFNDKFDRYLIGVNLVNEGWLEYNDNDILLNAYNDIYNIEDGVTEVEWRGKRIWANYTDEQIDSLVKLCKYLCSEYGIPPYPLSHNTYKARMEHVEGITYKSNYNDLYRDISPAFPFGKFLENFK